MLNSRFMDTTINEEIAAYSAIRADLEANHMGEWVVVHNREVVDFFQAFEEAAKTAVERFGRGPYLIRQIGAPPIELPASVMCYPLNGQNDVRLQ